MRKISHSTWIKMWLCAAIFPYLNVAVFYLTDTPPSIWDVAAFSVLASIGCIGSAVTHYQVKIEKESEVIN